MYTKLVLFTRLYRDARSTKRKKPLKGFIVGIKYYGNYTDECHN